MSNNIISGSIFSKFFKTWSPSAVSKTKKPALANFLMQISLKKESSSTNKIFILLLAICF